MPNTYLPVVLASTCVLPAVAGLLYYNRIDKTYHPFIWAMYLSVFSEAFTTMRRELGWADAIHYLWENMYYVSYFVLYTLFFFKQKIVSKEKLPVIWIIGLLALIVNLLFERPWQGRLYPKSVIYILVVIALSGRLLSTQVFNTAMPLHKNALFVICCGILFSAFYLVFMLMRIFKINQHFILSIMQYANALMYLIFFFAILRMPGNTNLSVTGYPKKTP